MFKYITTWSICYVLLAISLPLHLHAEEVQTDEKSAAADSDQKSDLPKNLSLNELALPSEVKNLNKQSGSIYYSPSIKGKVLIPVHVWGEITKSGLHFFPVDTTLINGLSLAGGASANGELDKVRVSRVEGGEVKNNFFNLEQGGSNEAYNFKLKPGDTVFIPKTRYYENRTYYTSLFGVIATILTSVLLYRQVKQTN